jgi:hypothetical protein
VRVADFGELARFCRIDGWTKEGSTDHDIWVKALPGGELLRTSTSHSSSKTPSRGRFKAILREQLKISEAEFWAALDSGKPVDRPGAPEPAEAPSIPAHLIAVLAGEMDLKPEDIAALDPEAAERMVHEHWGAPEEQRVPPLE